MNTIVCAVEQRTRTNKGEELLSIRHE
jgi:hypothetical protein